MKRSFALLCSFFALSVSPASTAQAQVHADQSEPIVTVSFTSAVLQSAEGQRELGALQTKYAPRQTELQTLSHQVETLQKQLSGDPTQLTGAARQAQEKSLDLLEKQLQRKAEDFRNDSQADSQQVYQRVAQKMFTFLQNFSQQKGFALVIDRGSDAAPVVWYAAKSIDITDDLIKAYNSHAEAAQPNAPTQTSPKALPSAPSPPK